VSTVDTQRLARLQSGMREAGLAALVLRLPENVVYATEYWPHHGVSVAIVPPEGQPLLLVPEIEAEYADPAWAEVVPFGWALLKDGDLYASYRRLLGEAATRWGLRGAPVGAELGFEIVAPSYRAAEPIVPAAPWAAALAEAFGEGVRDASGLIHSARAIKTPHELEKLRLANRIAELGMRAFLERLEPGMREAQVGALIEQVIRSEGPGTGGARLLRASAEVSAGAAGSVKATLLIPSTGRVIAPGDLVLVELGTVVDGYWSDLTYVAVAGEPSPRQREVYNAVLAAQQAAARELRAGAAWGAPDAAARGVLEEAGLSQYFVHITGHGIGLRYHEGIPLLAPGAGGVLEQGMVSSVEPGVYIPGFGGIRIEDIVAVGPDGPQFLSTPRAPW
jgi:Xaa-Pro dipeptidase